MNIPGDRTESSIGKLPLGSASDVVRCRQLVAHVASALSWSSTARTMLVTAASELARNTIIHGGGGTFSWEVVGCGGKRGVRLSFKDEGPGIADPHLAMTDGWSSRKGLGLGLPGTKRLVHEFELQSTPGRGTLVVIVRWEQPPLSFGSTT